MFVLAFIALSLSKTNSRKGRFLNLLPAFLIYVAYILCLGAVRGQLETDSYFLPGGMWTVHVFFLVIAIALFLGRDYILEFGKALVKA